MNVTSGPVIGYRLTRRQMHQCSQYLAANHLADETVLGGFFVGAPFLPQGVNTLLLITDEHVVLLSISKSSRHATHTAARRPDCRIETDSEPLLQHAHHDSTRSITLDIDGHRRQIIVFNDDLLQIHQLLETQPAHPRTIEQDATAAGAVRSGTAATPGLASLPKANLYLKVAAIAAVILAGFALAMHNMDQSESLRASFRGYLQAVNDSRPDDAFRFLTPYSREHLDQARWRAKFTGRVRSHDTRIEDIRFSDDGLTARVITNTGRGGKSRRAAVQTWKKLEGTWYRAYLEDIPDMVMPTALHHRDNKGGKLLGAR